MSDTIQEIECEVGDVTFTIFTNLPTGGNINTLEAALDNYSMRHDNHSGESFCRYVNSKYVDGRSDFWALTEEKWNTIKYRSFTIEPADNSDGYTIVPAED